jgi:hypothetical protein
MGTRRHGQARWREDHLLHEARQFTKLANGEIWLLVMYAKSVRGAIPAHILRAIREEIENG